MPTNPKLRKMRVTTSPISRRVLFHPRNEVKRANKLGRTSILYDDDTGMLNSQLSDNQWATNIGLEATQAPVKAEMFPLCIPPASLHLNCGSHTEGTSVKNEEALGHKDGLEATQGDTYLTSTPIKAETFTLCPPHLNHKSKMDMRQDIASVKNEECMSPLLYRLPGVTTSDLPPIYHLHSPSPTLQNIALDPDLDTKPCVNEESGASSPLPTVQDIAVDVNLDSWPLSDKALVASAADTILEGLHTLVDQLRERYTKDLADLESERDLLRLQLVYQEKYINNLQGLLSDRGMSPPPSPLMESQKHHFHF
ncbi:hypothetical protein DFH05DRAFT_1461717 [Lentinula detonsa]|uniref:Uncharacterized protein n=1 Tax=Lentinula detonsa TaxID=2804962 RepID=A0A9W8TW57_9AGAR|nr:hypothetical protein DFH05DRAFT_1461717 [Lentinula detonsa]